MCFKDQQIKLHSKAVIKKQVNSAGQKTLTSETSNPVRRKKLFHPTRLSVGLFTFVDVTTTSLNARLVSVKHWDFSLWHLSRLHATAQCAKKKGFFFKEKQLQTSDWQENIDQILWLSSADRTCPGVIMIANSWKHFHACVTQHTLKISAMKDIQWTFWIFYHS